MANTPQVMLFDGWNHIPTDLDELKLASDLPLQPEVGFLTRTDQASPSLVSKSVSDAAAHDVQDAGIAV